MFELYELARVLVAVLVGFVVVVVLSFIASPQPVVAPSTAPPAVIVPATTTAPLATTTLSVATSNPKVATTTVPKPVSKPAPKPVSPAPPKVEDLKITLNDAIQSFTDLSSGASTSTLSINDRVRAALVNIICTTEASGPFESISGSGVIIDPRGVILTNAHVAQFFLLRDYPHKNFVQCIIRTGSPAAPMYTAELLFLPPSWINKNASKIVQESPTGSGEKDYALLRITGGVSGNIKLPAQFPFVLTSLVSPAVGDDVLEAGYAAGFLGGITVQNNLFASSAYAKVQQLFTFETNTADLFALGGSIVAQHGSSGGAVTRTDGTLIGVIVTTTDAVDTSSRDLRAVATSYIVRDYESERGKTLEAALSADLGSEADIFARVFAPSERQALITALEK